jgi:hypothetical protein
MPNLELLNYERIGWPYKQGIKQKQQEFPQSSNIGFDCRNVKNVTSQAAGDILENVKDLYKEKHKKIWDYEIQYNYTPEKFSIRKVSAN